MTKISPSMLCALTISLVFSIGPLVLAGGRQGPESMAVAPFGWNRVVVAHAISTLPLSWILAVAATRAWPLLSRRWTVMFWAIAGVDIAVLSVFAGNFVAGELNTLNAGPFARLVVRTAWCLLLQLPWCLAGRALQKMAVSKISKSEYRDTCEVHPMGLLAICNFICWSLVVAILVPLSFVDTLSAKQTLIARQYWKELRIEKSRNVVRRLWDVGSTESLGNSDNTVIGREQPKSMQQDVLPKHALAMLRANVKYLSEEIKALQAGETTDSQQLQLGVYNAALDRLSQSRETLEPLARTNAEAAIKLAEICQWEKRWHDANLLFYQAIELSRSEKQIDSEAVAKREKLLLFAYDSLARGARELKQYERAEACYREAIADFPSLAAHFHSQLAHHCDLGGRPGEAIEHQRMAHQLAPEKYAAPASLAVKILSNSTPVGIFAPSASNNE